MDTSPYVDELRKVQEEPRIVRRKSSVMSVDSVMLSKHVELRMRTESGPGAKWRMRRLQCHLLLEAPTSSFAAKVISLWLLGVIASSVICFMFETMPEMSWVPTEFWYVIEAHTTFCFTVEYITRFICCSAVGEKKWDFVWKPMNMFDLIATIPFYLELVFVGFLTLEGTLLRIVRAIRLTRLVRILKLTRYSVGMRLLLEAVQNSMHALWSLVFLLCIALIIFASTAYTVEKFGCPSRADLAKEPLPGGLTKLDVYTQECGLGSSSHSTYGLCCDDMERPLDFGSIPSTLWWTIVTMTTVGYGDRVPRTTQGKCVGVMAMISGILLIALPVAIVGQKFEEAHNEYLATALHTKTSDDEGRQALKTTGSGSRSKLLEHRFLLEEMGREASGMAELMLDGQSLRNAIYELRVSETTKREEFKERLDEVLGCLDARELRSPSKGTGESDSAEGPLELS